MDLEQLQKKCTENKELRKLLWLRHGCTNNLYGDDGEMQCNRCMIDFKRDSVETIESRLVQPWFGGLAKMIENMKDMPPEFSKTVDDNLWDLI